MVLPGIRFLASENLLISSFSGGKEDDKDSPELN
jgi:hypothetical protein